MYFDALTAAAVADELRPLVGGRIQKVIAPDALSVAMEVFAAGQRRYLLATAEAEQARIHLLAQKPRRGVDTPSPLVLLLRKHVEGARLISVACPKYERVLSLEFAQEESKVTLVVEVMGRHSNIVLVDQSGAIMESIKRVGPEQSRYRLVLPRHTYSPPPPQTKPRPEDVSETDMARILNEAADDEASALVAGVRGVSPLLAREVIARASRAAGEPSARARAVLDAFDDLWSAAETGQWAPSVALEGESVVAYAPYELTAFEEHQPVESISAAIEAYWASRGRAEPYAAARAQVEKEIGEASGVLDRKRRALERSLAGRKDPEILREMGEAILTYGSSLEPGRKVLIAPAPDGGRIEIPLDPTLSAGENAQACFREYRKARAAAAEVPELLDGLAQDEEYLAQLRYDLAQAQDREEIDEVHRALVESGWVHGEAARTRVAPSRPLALQSRDGHTILVGRNARQNDEVTFRRAAPDDLWLHAQGVPGAHVVIKSAGKPVDEETVLEGAALAAYYSQGRMEARVDVDCTEKRHVRKPRGASHGQVRYTGARTLRVAPRGPDEH